MKKVKLMVLVMSVFLAVPALAQEKSATERLFEKDHGAQHGQSLTVMLETLGMIVTSVKASRWRDVLHKAEEQALSRTTLKEIKKAGKLSKRYGAASSILFADGLARAIINLTDYDPGKLPILSVAAGYPLVWISDDIRKILSSSESTKDSSENTKSTQAK